MDNNVVGPKIINMRNQAQNPMYIKENLMVQKMVYYGLKNNNKIQFYLGIAINKLLKNIFLLKNRNKESLVYQLHGSFVIFGRKVLDKLENVYDEEMFLFAEESYLALRLKNAGIISIYNPNIVVQHKEDGSMRFRDDISEQLRGANIYVYEKYYGFKTLNKK